MNQWEILMRYRYQILAVSETRIKIKCKDRNNLICPAPSRFSALQGSLPASYYLLYNSRLQDKKRIASHNFAHQ
jgi:hypothetical protein